MNQKTFNKTVKTRIREIEGMLTSKGAEYAGADRLSNFKEGASFRQRTPEGVCMDYVTKHIIALNEFIARIESGVEVKSEQWVEKTQDIAIYMILMEAILIDQGRIDNAGL